MLIWFYPNKLTVLTIYFPLYCACKKAFVSILVHSFPSHVLPVKYVCLCHDAKLSLYVFLRFLFPHVFVLSWQFPVNLFLWHIHRLSSCVTSYVLSLWVDVFWYIFIILFILSVCSSKSYISAASKLFRLMLPNVNI